MIYAKSRDAAEDKPKKPTGGKAAELVASKKKAPGAE